ncbi:MAG: Rpn family recombination-promoting nuclease/putative transposase [Clostridium sp.]|nr:Rpn family recombination-promoting nuclease/putative transposase [Clostridium sp.]
MINEKIEYKFYSCKYDRTFKEVFLDKNNEDILKVLLEETLGLKIETIKLLPTEMNEGNINIARKTVDALLETDKGKIEIEVNSNIETYVHPRNLAYLCNIYSRHTLIGKEYTEDIDIIQLNLTYGMKDTNIIREYKIIDKENKEFVKNFKICEINMDKIMEFWYDKDKEKIEEFKHLIMLGLDKEELVKMDNKDKIVKKYMDEVIVVNSDIDFQEYMSKEEDERKIFNSRMSEATRKGLEQGLEQGLQQGLEQGMKEGIEQGSSNKAIEIAKNMLEEKFDIQTIAKITKLSIREIEKLN